MPACPQWILRIRQLLILLAAFSWIQFLQAQDFVLGREELANVDVYSLLQTQDGILYAATDNGLFAFRHGKFEQLPGPETQHGSSLFSLQTNQKGQLFCYNLSGQVFKVDQGRLKLVLDLPASAIGHFSCFAFDQQDQLIFASKQVMRFSESGQVIDTLIDYGNEHCCFALSVDEEGTIYAANTHHFELDAFKGNTVQQLPLHTNSRGAVLESIWHQVILNGKILIFGSNNGIWTPKDAPVQDFLPPRIRERVKSISEDEAIGMSHDLGARCIQLRGDSLVETQRFFPDQFISSTTAGLDGTLYFGTFGQGVLMVPNRQAKSIPIPQAQGQIRSLTTDRQGHAFVGTQTGQLYKVDEKAELLKTYTAMPLVFLKHSGKLPIGFDPDFPYLVSTANSPFGSIKDAFELGDTAILSATKIGVLWMGANPGDTTLWSPLPIRPQTWKLKTGDLKCQSATMADGTIYYATAEAVYAVDRKGHKSPITFEGNPIACNDLLVKGKLLAVATQGKGLLVFKGNKVLAHFDEGNGLLSNQVHKLANWRDQLLIGSNAGLQMLDTRKGSLRNLGIAEGLVPGAVRDFALQEDRLWAAVKDELFSIDLSQLSPSMPPLDWILDSLMIGGEKVALDGEALHMPYNRNWLDIFWDYRHLAYQAEARIRYRLLGLDDSWQVEQAQNHHITFKSLPPGDYTLQLQLFCKGKASPLKSIPFFIRPPFWQQWWFFLICAMLLATLITSYYTLRIRRIRKANEDQRQRQQMEKNLVESRLKALRSQMNPHFIFNSLNSIQDLILRQDTDRAYDYVVLFAELVRSTLHHSEKDFIPMEKELEFLDVYLSLEKLRFKEDLEYTIRYEGDIDILVPSMVVQPFIENALLHGLLHKSGLKKIDISFELGEALICRIKDNGIGRARAKEIKERQGGRHTSFSLGAIRQRLEMLHAQYGEELGYTFTDLEEDGQATGTLAEIRMSFRRMD